ncbi:hypothetical protein KW459_15805 [Vibrio fluvialis]|nr:hypothetical protein [Vibrio fluvialis]
MNTSKRIKKNATRQIADLLAQASYFEMESHSMQIDDSMASNGCVEVDRAYVDNFMRQNYSSLIIEATYDDSAKPVTVTISDGPYYFSKQVQVHFSPKPIEVVNVESDIALPRMTYAAVKAYRAAGFISPLNHGAKHVDQSTVDSDKVIQAVEVIWSESRYFNQLRKAGERNIEQTIDLDQYNSLAALEVASYRRNQYVGGYTKTKVRITTGRGEVFEFRHDICPKEPTLSGSWSSWVDYCRSEEEKQTQPAQINV